MMPVERTGPAVRNRRAADLRCGPGIGPRRRSRDDGWVSGRIDPWQGRAVQPRYQSSTLARWSAAVRTAAQRKAPWLLVSANLPYALSNHAA